MSQQPRYADDVLTGDWRRKRTIREVTAELDMVLEDAASGFCGAIVELSASALTLESRHGKRRQFPLTPAGFLLEGKAVTILPPSRTQAKAQRSASGSIAVPNARAQTAKASRIYVEGIHDAELVEHIWGHDLRVEGIVVEPLHGIDDLPAVIAEFNPTPNRRLGVLVDHLVPGSKEQRLVATISDPNVCVTGHPYVDIWEAVRPERLGLKAWPAVPRDQDWKTAIAATLGCSDAPSGWRRIRSAINDYTDLQPPLLAAVEELIDFVTVPQ